MTLVGAEAAATNREPTINCMVTTGELARSLRKNIVPSFLVLRRPKNRKAARATFATFRSQWAMPTENSVKHDGRRV